MATYCVPKMKAPVAAKASEVVLIASGDLRQSANKVCWPAQAEVEAAVTKAFAAEGWTVRRAHPYREDLQHGVIFNQRMGMDGFTGGDPKAPGGGGGGGGRCGGRIRIARTCSMGSSSTSGWAWTCSRGSIRRRRWWWWRRCGSIPVN